MSVEGIHRSEHPDNARGPYDYLLNDTPEGNVDPVQLRVFLDGINGYLSELDKLDLPPDYLRGINQVLDEQVSLVVGEKVTQHPGEAVPGTPGEHGCVVPGEQVPGEHVKPAHGEHGKHVHGKHVPPVVEKEPPASGHVPCGGKAPAGMPPELWDMCVAAGRKTGVDPYILAAQMEKESQYGKALAGSPSAGDGLMQVEPSTRAAYAAKFQATMGHAYNHASKEDQVAMAAVILADKGGSSTNMLQKYNGGDGWRPGICDSYGRVIKADEYASSVVTRAKAMAANAG